MAAFRPRQQQTATRYDLLPPEKKVADRKPVRSQRRQDVIDAEFVVLRDTRPRGASSFRYNDNHAPGRPSPPAKPAHASRAARFARAVVACERTLRRVPERAFSVIVALLFVAVFASAGGFYGIAAATASSPAQVRPLDITHVSLTPQDANGMRILLVNGIVENRTGGTLAVPAIRADLMAGDRVVASTIIEPPATEMNGGHSRGFSARLPHPGGKMPDVRLSFAEPGVSRP